jgi:NAD+ diphosphatase
MLRPNAFSGAELDRVGARRIDERWLAERLADPTSRGALFTEDAVLATDTGPGGPRPALVGLPLASALSDDEPALLGLSGDTALFAFDASRAAPESLVQLADRPRLVGLREAATVMSQADGGLVAYGATLMNWHRRHRHCAVCGAPTRSAEAGHLRRCPACGAPHHPRLDPVVIMLVSDGDRALLGRKASWPAGRFSALAGFVEPGEALEEAVAREVREESGVEVSHVRYRSSQPWPFPSSLMLGFTADYAGGEVAPRDGELQEVGWFSRAELLDAVAGRGEIRLPEPVAIARRLVDGWLEQG